MKTCEQTRGQTILEHGQAVASTFKTLFASTPPADHHLPSVILDNLDFLKARCPSADILETYHIFHDCGKPSCLTIDADGRRHFPNHAMISARDWLVAGGDPLIGRLIEHDMDLHLMKPADAAAYPHLDLAPALILTAWAELHANAPMFGGFDSTSFKIKAKCLTKTSRNLIQRLKEQS